MVLAGARANETLDRMFKDILEDKLDELIKDKASSERAEAVGAVAMTQCEAFGRMLSLKNSYAVSEFFRLARHQKSKGH